MLAWLGLDFGGDGASLAGEVDLYFFMASRHTWMRREDLGRDSFCSSQDFGISRLDRTGLFLRYIGRIQILTRETERESPILRLSDNMTFPDISSHAPSFPLFGCNA